MARFAVLCGFGLSGEMCQNVFSVLWRRAALSGTARPRVCSPVCGTHAGIGPNECVPPPSMAADVLETVKQDPA